jgi:uncharacterized protein
MSPLKFFGTASVVSKKSVALMLVSAAVMLPPGSMAQPGPATATGLPAGSGPGIHSPNSPFVPLSQRSDVLPWSLLTDVKPHMVNKRVLPAFPAAVLALNDKTKRIQGFMMPLEPGEKHTHFLLTSVPLTCSFCTPGGPESMVEVYTKSAIRYTMDAVVVEGKLQVLSDDPFGLYYRMPDGVVVK